MITPKDRDLLEIPMLFVEEFGKTNMYFRVYTLNGLPHYVPNKDKNKLPEIKIEEALLLPITNDEFKNNKTDYFFGYRMLLSNAHQTTLNVVGRGEGLTRFQIHFEAMRVRFYPEGDKRIIIDRIYDQLFPTQHKVFQFPPNEVDEKALEENQKIIDYYFQYYVDRTV